MMGYHIINHGDGPTAYFYAGKVGTGNPGMGGFGFVWNWINIFGLITIVLLLLPNIIYAVKYRDEKNLCENKFMNILEQVGRYGSMLFMVVCLKSGGFCFSSTAAFLAYCFGNLLILLAYWVLWGVFFHVSGRRDGRQDGVSAVSLAGKREVRSTAALQMSLAVLPSCLFLLDGIALGYVPLIVFALLFAAGHIYVTDRNNKNRMRNPVSD